MIEPLNLENQKIDFADAEIKHKSNQELVHELKSLREAEQTIVNRSIELLREVEERRLYLLLGHSSLYEFCVSELKYSEGSAHRRIAAMRLLKSVPEIQTLAATGKLSLTAMAQAQSYFRRKENAREPVKKEQKLELLKKLEDRSARDCEREILRLDPKAHRPDRIVAKTEELTEIRLTVDNEFMKTLDRLRDLLAKKYPDGSTKDILHHVLKAELNRLEKPITRRKRTLKKRAEKVKTSGKLTTNNKRKSSRKSIPESVRREVFIKHNFECAFTDKATGHKCSAKRYLEIDHIIPVSKGGTNALANLQLMCSAHNKLKSNSDP